MVPSQGVISPAIALLMRAGARGAQPFQLLGKRGSSGRIGDPRARPAVLWVCESIPSVYLASERLKQLPRGVPRRGDIQAFIRGEFYPWHQEMQLMVSGVAVAHPKDAVLLTLEPSKRHMLEGLHHLLFHPSRDVFSGPEAQDT
jgi:hypothetical protein